MFSAWSINEGTLNTRYYYREAKDIIITIDNIKIEFKKVFCTVSYFNYKLLKVKSKNKISLSWYSSIMGVREDCESKDPVSIAESYGFHEEFLAIIWSDKYIVENLKCEVESPFVVPYLDSISF